MSRKLLPALSPAETEILRLIWQLGRGTVQQVREKLPPRRRIAYATVQTLLRRLEKKGYLRHESQCKAHVFSPAAKREELMSLLRQREQVTSPLTSLDLTCHARLPQ